MKNSETVGTTSINNKNIFDRDKEKKFKQQIILKSFLCILLTNLLTYMSIKEEKTQVLDKKTINLSSYQRISVELTNFTPLKDEPTKVTILNRYNKRMISEAYIITKSEEETYGSDQNKYIIAIKPEDVSKIIKLKNRQLFSYPYYQSPKIKITKKGAPYEISI